MKKLVPVILALTLVGSSVFAEGTPAAGQFGIQTAVTLTNAGLGSSFDVGPST